VGRTEDCMYALSQHGVTKENWQSCWHCEKLFWAMEWRLSEQTLIFLRPLVMYVQQLLAVDVRNSF